MWSIDETTIERIGAGAPAPAPPFCGGSREACFEGAAGEGLLRASFRRRGRPAAALAGRRGLAAMLAVEAGFPIAGTIGVRGDKAANRSKAGAAAAGGGSTVDALSAAAELGAAAVNPDPAVPPDVATVASGGLTEAPPGHIC